MKLTNFSLAPDNIALEHLGLHLDLHNCFDFIAIHHNIPNRQATLEWSRNPGNWVSLDLPSAIAMHFVGIRFLRVRQRDQNTPYTEDACLNSIGFMWNNMIEEMGAFASNTPSDDCDHLSLEFMGGMALKIDADEASLSTAP